MRSLIRLVTFSSCLLIALSGCANSPTQDSRETDTATAAKPSPTKVPVNPGDDLKIECSNADRTIKTSFSPPQEAWETPRENRDNCTTSYISQLDFSNEGPIKYYVLTDIEEKALEVADYDGIDSLSTLYNICAKADLGDLGESKPWRAGQIQEVSAALVLCPDHPDRKEVEKRMKKGEVKENAREDGKIFNSGTYKVGADIQPGTYVAESETPFENCYWERLDSSGEIIDNNFINSGFRAEVSIKSSDYSFTAEGCGEWVKQ